MPLADLNADMQAAVKEAGGGAGKGNMLTVDGVHMNPMGNRMMAIGVLKAFGLNEEQIKKADAAWLDIPKACEFSTKAAITLRQYEQLNALAAKEKKSVNDLVNDASEKAIESLLSASPPEPAKP